MSKTSQTRLSATLHLSVVPRSAVSHGKERHLVAAIQFAATMDAWQQMDASMGNQTHNTTQFTPGISDALDLRMSQRKQMLEQRALRPSRNRHL